ncbi:hypothetical protein BH24ACI2_BH24ACI2_06190 [soil metagenome]|jgi:hypothetical protein|nr:hypothetical protein [Acidobacteriota bacterium]
MSVVKFQTTVKNGSIIIPTELRNLVKGKVEVFVRLKNKSNDEEEPYDIISELMKNPLPVSDPKPLTRDEIYDRNQKFR